MVILGGQVCPWLIYTTQKSKADLTPFFSNELYRQIGQLKVENDFLSRNLTAEQKAA